MKSTSPKCGTLVFFLIGVFIVCALVFAYTFDKRNNNQVRFLITAEERISTSNHDEPQQNQSQTSTVQTSLVSDSWKPEDAFDFTSQEGKLKALQTHLYLTNKLGEIGWLPLDMEFGKTRGNSLQRYAVEKHFFPFVVEQNFAKGPTCMGWGMSYLGTIFKEICTEAYPIEYGKSKCGGKFGPFTEGKGFCVDIHKTEGIIPDDMIDMLISPLVFEHLYDPFLAIKNVHRIVKPGGRVIWIAPQQSIYHEVPNHFWGYTAQGARYMFTEAGFCVKWAHGLTNTFLCIASLMGMSLEEVNKEEYNKTDDIGPCLIGVIAEKKLNPQDACPPGDYQSVSELSKYRRAWSKKNNIEMGRIKA